MSFAVGGMLQLFGQGMPFFTSRGAMLRIFVIWGLFYAAIIGMILAGSERSVLAVYTLGAEAWQQQAALYDGTGRNFIYLPTFAMLFSPFTALPELVREMLWRTLTIGGYLGGVYALCVKMRASYQLFPLCSLVVLPIAWAAGLNGQVNLLIAGSMLLGLTALIDQKYIRCAAWFALSFALKPISVVLILLVGALYPRTRIPLLVGIGAALGLPYLFAEPAYVYQQYLGYWEAMRLASLRGMNDYYAHWFGWWKAWGWPVAAELQFLTRVICAPLTLGIVYYTQRKYPSPQREFYLFSFAMIYLMLMNPLNERNTFALFAPVLGILVSHCLLVERNFYSASVLISLALCITGAYEFGRCFPFDIRSVWLAPFAAFLCLLWLLARITRPVVAHPISYTEASAVSKRESSVIRRTTSAKLPVSS